MEIVRPHLPPRAPTARLGILMTALIVLVAGYGASRTSPFQWFLLRASLHSQFPQVQWITTRELADCLEDRHRPAPVLLDVRTVEEWNVSHLPRGAACRSGGFRGNGFARHGKRCSGRYLSRGRLSLHRIYHALASRVHAYGKSWGQLLTDDVRAGL
jgi:hypothetical protein